MICKDITFYLFNDILRTQKSQIQKIRLLNTDFATKIEISKKQTSTFIYVIVKIKASFFNLSITRWASPILHPAIPQEKQSHCIAPKSNPIHYRLSIRIPTAVRKQYLLPDNPYSYGTY